MAARSVASAPPPFYWKVSVPEKDYMSENYRRIRQIANQSQQKRNAPMKAAFIPGVTKNEKYAHVASRVGEFLKTKKAPEIEPNGNFGATGNRRSAGPNQIANRRLSKSSTDLRQNPHGLQSAQASQNPAHSHSSAPIRRRRGSQESLPQESVYNWRFKEDLNVLPSRSASTKENFVVDDGHPDSARSGSSTRTSRGCNTEETRILDDPVKCFELDKQIVNSADRFDSDLIDGETSFNSQPKIKSRSVHTIGSTAQTSAMRKNDSSAQWEKNRDAANSGASVADIMRGRETQRSGKVQNSQSNTSLNGVRQSHNCVTNGTANGGAGDFKHAPGIVPKYLKQRQEEWKMQEQERKETEKNAHVPPGYVLLTESERQEHLKTFKRNYDSLIDDLNRIPITNDTIRVREHKIQLENQLTRLEEAMKTFSRPRVWIKVE